MAPRPADTTNRIRSIRHIIIYGYMVLGSIGSVAAQPTGATIQPLPISEAAGIIGRSVHSPDGHDIGRIVDVIVDQSGNPRAAVIDFGGYMGIGNRRIAVDWSALRFLPGNSDNPVTLQLTLDQIKATPQYREDAGKLAVVAPAAPPPVVAPAAPPPVVAPAAPPPIVAPAAPVTAN